MTDNIVKSEDEWKKCLTPEEFHILRKEGTERSFSHPLNKEYRPGKYVCAGCETPLFKSDMKFDSGTGWPSFYTTLPGVFETKSDRKLFMQLAGSRDDAGQAGSPGGSGGARLALGLVSARRAGRQRVAAAPLRVVCR